jgi:hypothetical protein
LKIRECLWLMLIKSIINYKNGHYGGY